MVPLHFNFKDIFRAPKMGFSAKKIWIHFSALFYGLLIYDILVYLGGVLSGNKFLDMWRAMHFFPCPFASAFKTSAFLWTWYADILFYVGVAVIAILTFLASAAVAKVTIEQLRGNDFFSRKEAWTFVRKHWRSIIFTPVALVVLIAILFIGGMIVGAWQCIPYVGELTTSLLTIPIFVVALFFVFLVVVTLSSFLLTPAIVACTKNDTFETSFELFSTMSSQSWRLIIYQIILNIIRVAATWLFALAAILGVRVMFNAYYWSAWLISSTDKVEQVFAYAAGFLPNLPRLCMLKCKALFPWLNQTVDSFGNLLAWCTSGKGIFKGLPNLLLGLESKYANLDFFYRVDIPSDWSWAYWISGFIVGLAFTLIMIFVISYSLSTNSVGQTLIYTILRKKKDDENLLEFFDEEFQEPIIPPVEETKPEAEKAKAPEGKAKPGVGKKTPTRKPVAKPKPRPKKTK